MVNVFPPWRFKSECNTAQRLAHAIFSWANRGAGCAASASKIPSEYRVSVASSKYDNALTWSCYSKWRIHVWPFVYYTECVFIWTYRIVWKTSILFAKLIEKQTCHYFVFMKDCLCFFLKHIFISFVCMYVSTFVCDRIFERHFHQH